MKESVLSVHLIIGIVKKKKKKKHALLSPSV